MAEICYLIFICTSSVLALANSQRDLTPPSCSSSSFVSNSSCSQIIYGMINCISFLGTGAFAAKPDGSCCSGFKSVLKANGDCICQAVRDAPQMGIKLNMTRAAELPSACGVFHFSISKTCGLSDSLGTTPPPAKSPKLSPKAPLKPVPPSRKVPVPLLPPIKSHAPSPQTKPTPIPTPAPTQSTPKTPVKSAKSPAPTPTQSETAESPKSKSSGLSLPKSKSSGTEEGLSQVPAPTPANLNSGSYSLDVCFAVVSSLCMIYLSFSLYLP